MDKAIDVIFKYPGESCGVKTVPNSLASVQSMIEGYIEIIPFPGLENTIIILNEDGKLKKLKPNVYISDYDDVLVGNIMVVGADGEEIVSVDPEKIAYIFEVLNGFSYEKLFDESRFIKLKDLMSWVACDTYVNIYHKDDKPIFSNLAEEFDFTNSPYLEKKIFGIFVEDGTLSIDLFVKE